MQPSLPMEQVCALARDLSSIRDPLLELLTLRDIVALLATCQQIRFDSDFVAHVLQTNAFTKYFYQGCAHDFCVQKLKVGVLTSNKRLMNSYYASKYGCDTSWFAIPFIRPLDISGDATVEQLRAALDAEIKGLGDIYANDGLYCSEPNLHLANIKSVVTMSGPEWSCDFCGTVNREIEKFEEESTPYWEDRKNQLETLPEKACADGYDSDTDEYTAREAAFKAEREEKDHFYSGSVANQCTSVAASCLAERGRLKGPLLVEEAIQMEDDMVGQAANWGYMDVLCPSVYRPLSQLFARNGFRHVVYGHVPFYKAEMSKWGISSVEMIGALTRQGFYAGVYFVKFRQ